MELIIAWAFAGWCGTGPPILRIRRPPRTPPLPIDYYETRPLIEILVGIVGGLAGGFLFNSVGHGEALSQLNLAATSFGAFLGGNILSRLVALTNLGTKDIDRQAG